MLRENFMKFNLIDDLHRELTNVLLISLNSSNYFYCYCQNGKKCDLCDLVHFFILKRKFDRWFTTRKDFEIALFFKRKIKFIL